MPAVHAVARRRHDSVRADNAGILARECPFVYVSQIIGSHWRPAILWKIATGVGTYNALRAALVPITDKMLATELRALADEHLVIRFEVTTRRSRYELTARGASLVPLLAVMEEWALTDRVRRGESIAP